MKFHIGTSGWHYKHWLGGVFYPPGTTGPEMFQFYARHFNRGVRTKKNFPQRRKGRKERRKEE